MYQWLVYRSKLSTNSSTSWRPGVKITTVVPKPAEVYVTEAHRIVQLIRIE